MTAWGTVDMAVEAMRRGARDFIQKPWDNARLLAPCCAPRSNSVARSAGRGGSRPRTRAARRRAARARRRSPAMQPVLQRPRARRPSDANVLITGENGTGKTCWPGPCTTPRLAPAAVRRGQHRRAPEAWSRASCSATNGRVHRCAHRTRRPLRGRRRRHAVPRRDRQHAGTATGAAAARAARPASSNASDRSRTRRIDVRLLSATNADLQARSGTRAIPRDLLFRLNTVEVRMPPLRERREDIPDARGQFLCRATHAATAQTRRLRPAALQAMLEHRGRATSASSITPWNARCS